MRASVVCLLIAGTFLAGCVTRGTHDEVVRERDRLRVERRELSKRVEMLEASNESLSNERVALLEELEDLRQARGSLERDVRKLERRHDEVSRALAEREQEVSARREELERLRGTYEGLVSDLESELHAGQIQIEQLRDGVRLNLQEEILFDSGSAKLKERGREVLTLVAGRLLDLPDLVEVQGHTDDVPIAKGYASNWELAAARATGVVRWLQEQGVEPGRLRGISFGEYQPVASNETAQGRSRNRRIELRLRPDPGAAEAALAEPLPTPTDAAPPDAGE